MRKLKKYVPRDDFDMPKSIDHQRYTAVLIRQSDHRAEDDHVFSRESQLKLTSYAQRLRGDPTDEMVRVYDEGAGMSGQKRIDHRKYDCTKPSDRNSLLEKMIASRNYLDDHVLGRMNGNQEAKALQGLFDGRNLAMGYVTQGKKKQQIILVYEPWARVIVWLFLRFKELNSFAKLCREIEAMPYLFPDPSADDFMRYTFKIRMTKVPGGFKPSCPESIKYMLTNPAYIGAWVYEDAIVVDNNHPAIVDRDLFLWPTTN